MKLLLTNTINEKSLTIMNLSPNNINNIILAIQNDFAKNYYAYINLAIESYGKTQISYGSNLNYTKKIIYERFMNNQDGDDLAEEAKKLVESKDVQETLYLLRNRALNNYNGINNLNAFKDIFSKINNYLIDLNIKYLMIKEMIIENKYNEEIIAFLNGKLNTLQSKLNNYYTKINNKFNSTYIILKNNMSSIYSYISSCESITESVLYHEYWEIKKVTKAINYKYSNYIPEFSRNIEYESKSDHMTNEAKAYIYNINEYAEFKLDFTYNGGIWERPKLKATIVDKSRPNKIVLDFFSNCGECCIEGHMYNITLNGVDFTTVVEYDIKTSSIKINTYENIEKSSITESAYRKEQILKIIEQEWDGIWVNRTMCLKKENLTIYEKNTTEINAKHFNDLQIFTK